MYTQRRPYRNYQDASNGYSDNKAEEVFSAFSTYCYDFSERSVVVASGLAQVARSPSPILSGYRLLCLAAYAVSFHRETHSPLHSDKYWAPQNIPFPPLLIREWTNLQFPSFSLCCMIR